MKGLADQRDDAQGDESPMESDTFQPLDYCFRGGRGGEGQFAQNEVRDEVEEGDEKQNSRSCCCEPVVVAEMLTLKDDNGGDAAHIKRLMMLVLRQQLRRQQESSALRRIAYVCYWLFKLCIIFTITSLTLVALFYSAGQEYSHLPRKPIYAFYRATPLYAKQLKAAVKILKGKNSRILNLYLGEHAQDGWDSLLDFSEYLAYTLQSKKGVKIITKTIKGESNGKEESVGNKNKIKEGAELYKLEEFSSIYPFRRGIRRLIGKIFHKLNVTSPKKHNIKIPRNTTLLLSMRHFFMAGMFKRLWVFTIPDQETVLSLKQFIKELKLLDQANPSNYILLVSRRKLQFSNPSGKSVVPVQFYIDQFILRDLSQKLLDFLRVELDLANEAQAELVLCQTNYSLRAINAFLFKCKLKRAQADCRPQLDTLHLSRVESEPTAMVLKELCTNGVAEVIQGYDESLLFEFGAVLRDKVEWRNQNSRMMFEIANGQSCVGTTCNLTWHLSKDNHLFEDELIIGISEEYYPANASSNNTEQINSAPQIISQGQEEVQQNPIEPNDYQIVVDIDAIEQNDDGKRIEVEAEAQPQKMSPQLKEPEITEDEFPPHLKIPSAVEEVL